MTKYYEYLVMPFGLMNAPAVFQLLVNDMLCNMLNNDGFVYQDDILNFSKDIKSHEAHLKSVLLCLVE